MSRLYILLLGILIGYNYSNSKITPDRLDLEEKCIQVVLDKVDSKKFINGYNYNKFSIVIIEYLFKGELHDCAFQELKK